MKGVWWGLRRSWKSCEIDCCRVTGRWMSAVLWHHADLWWRPADTSVPVQPFKRHGTIMLSQITMSDMRGKDYDWLEERCFVGESGLDWSISLVYLGERAVEACGSQPSCGERQIRQIVQSVNWGELDWVICSWFAGGPRWLLNIKLKS